MGLKIRFADYLSPFLNNVIQPNRTDAVAGYPVPAQAGPAGAFEQKVTVWRLPFVCTGLINWTLGRDVP